jgi:hypothetical protein
MSVSSSYTNHISYQQSEGSDPLSMVMIDKPNFGEEFVRLYTRIAQLCNDKPGCGDPFSYARGKEIYASIILNHDISKTFSGPDAFTKCVHPPQLRLPVEYKSTMNPQIRGLYSGISVQDTWELEYKYLKNEKIGKYLHFYNRFDETHLIESWTVPSEIVLKLLSDKIKKKYFDNDGNINKNTNKDPRICSSITCKEIKEYGFQVFKKN